MHRNFRFLMSLGLSAVFAISLCAAPLVAQGGGGLFGFQKTGDYLLELDGRQVDGARVYRSSAAQAVLIISDELPAPVLIRPRQRTVEKVSLLKMNEKPDGSIDLLPNPVYASEPGFEVEGGDVLFSVEGRKARLLPKPALVGFQSATKIYSHSPEYATRSQAYGPGAADVAKLKEESRDVRIQVFFGTWCPACGQMVPRILRVAEQVRGSKVQFAFYGLDREFSGDEEANRLGIKSVPTGVLWVDGKEVGRLSGNDWLNPEQAILGLIN